MPVGDQHLGAADGGDFGGSGVGREGGQEVGEGDELVVPAADVEQVAEPRGHPRRGDVDVLVATEVDVAPGERAKAAEEPVRGGLARLRERQKSATAVDVGREVGGAGREGLALVVGEPATGRFVLGAHHDHEGETVERLASEGRGPVGVGDAQAGHAGDLVPELRDVVGGLAATQHSSPVEPFVTLARTPSTRST